MNSSVIRANILRFVVLFILQILLFSRMNISWGSFSYIHFYLTPIIIMLFPIRMPKPMVIVLAFIIGLLLDMYHNTPGVHAGASVLIGYLRDWVMRYIEPFEGYNVDASPTIHNMGFQWFLIYSSILLFIYMLAFFSLEYFSHIFVFDILMNTIFSFIASYTVLILYMLIFRPKV